MGDQWDHMLEFKCLLKCSIKKRCGDSFMKKKNHILLQSLTLIVSADGIINSPLGSFCHRLKDLPFEFHICRFCMNKIDHCTLMLISIMRLLGTKKSRQDYPLCKRSAWMTVYCTLSHTPSIEYLICQLPVIG